MYCSTMRQPALARLSGGAGSTCQRHPPVQVPSAIRPPLTPASPSS